MEIIRVRYIGNDRRILLADSVNWTGVGLVFGMTYLAETKKYLENMTGVYILQKSFQNDPVTYIYIGESATLHSRLGPHHHNPAFDWDTVYAFWSEKNKLTKAHVLWVEQRLISAINNTCVLMNRNQREKQLVMDEVIKQEADLFATKTLEVCCLLGVDFFNLEIP